MAASPILAFLTLTVSAHSSNLFEPVPSPIHSHARTPCEGDLILRSNLCLRGGGWGLGWPHAPSGNPASQGQESKESQSTTVPLVATAATSSQNAETPPQQVSLATHAVDYAVAGSMDGIRSGFSQGIGNQLSRWVESAFHNGAGFAASRLAFAGLSVGLPYFRPQGNRAVCAASPSESGERSAEYENRVCVCFVTSPSAAVADNLSIALVESKSVACVNQVPGITSVYMWEGKINRDSEVLLIMKTLRSKIGSVAALIKEKHPYEVPELVVMDVVDGLPDYLGWVKGVVAAKPSPAQPPS